MRIRMLVVLAAVIAFAAVGAGWKWQKSAAPPVHLAGWSWDGSSVSAETS
jgi:hypothetical protein